MNPLVQEVLGSLVRHGLQILAGYLVARGVWTDAQAASYIGPLALMILSFGWNYYQKWMARQKLNTALASSKPMSEDQVTKMVKDRDIATPPATVPSDVVPRMEK